MRREKQTADWLIPKRRVVDWLNQKGNKRKMKQGRLK